MNDRDSLRELSELDAQTEWKLPRSVQPTTGGDDSVADLSLDDDDCDEQDNILDCLCGMKEAGQIQDLIVIVNDTEENMIIFTDLDRNDIIMGRLSVAPLNWWETQRQLQMEDGGEE